MKKEKNKLNYAEKHIVIDGIEYKLCTDCENWLECNLENFYSSKSSPDGLHTYCKKCAILKTQKRREENPGRQKELDRKRYVRNPKYFADKHKRYYQNNKEREAERLRLWQISNTERVKEYNENRMNNKKHEISDEEWIQCKSYFNNSCAYCNFTFEEHKEKEGQDLHKEHVNHNGANDLSNCIPSCRSCNSSKWQHDFEEWYSCQDFYNKKNYKKIIKWLNGDYKQYIEDKQVKNKNK